MTASDFGSNGPRFLLLMRHAEAGHPGGTRDRDRPLTAHGRTEAAEAGRWMSGQHWPLDAALTSDALRARDSLTAAAVVDHNAEVRATPALWDATADEVLAKVRETTAGVTGLLVVGHAPSVPGLARELCGPQSAPAAVAAMADRFPTAAVAAFRIRPPWSELDYGVAELLEFFLPGR